VAADDLFVVDVDGGEKGKLADNARDPVWSPDGAGIAFTVRSQGEQLETSSVHVVKADETRLVLRPVITGWLFYDGGKRGT